MYCNIKLHDPKICLPVTSLRTILSVFIKLQNQKIM